MIYGIYIYIYIYYIYTLIYHYIPYIPLKLTISCAKKTNHAPHSLFFARCSDAFRDLGHGARVHEVLQGGRALHAMLGGSMVVRYVGWFITTSSLGFMVIITIVTIDRFFVRCFVITIFYIWDRSIISTIYGSLILRAYLRRILSIYELTKKTYEASN